MADREDILTEAGERLHTPRRDAGAHMATWKTRAYLVSPCVPFPQRTGRTIARMQRPATLSSQSRSVAGRCSSLQAVEQCQSPPNCGRWPDRERHSPKHLVSAQRRPSAGPACRGVSRGPESASGQCSGSSRRAPAPRGARATIKLQAPSWLRDIHLDWYEMSA
jgi:hypothetical protein